MASHSDCERPFSACITIADHERGACFVLDASEEHCLSAGPPPVFLDLAVVEAWYASGICLETSSDYLSPDKLQPALLSGLPSREAEMAV